MPHAIPIGRPIDGRTAFPSYTELLPRRAAWRQCQNLGDGSEVGGERDGHYLGRFRLAESFIAATVGRRRNRADLRDQRTREHRPAAADLLTLFDVATWIAGVHREIPVVMHG
ncbi:hypothetical protein [Nocardia noduli]|uniref:hypothetical protein n=1 Tax=Nocardia noduli TaxID=2815722 RepID=UPI001C23F2F3|nr:hypothetical protein [Nocardia noduli]